LSDIEGFGSSGILLSFLGVSVGCLGSNGVVGLVGAFVSGVFADSASSRVASFLWDSFHFCCSAFLLSSSCLRYGPTTLLLFVDTLLAVILVNDLLILSPGLHDGKNTDCSRYWLYDSGVGQDC
jgi:uncharacterized membrane protein YjgN (DUF898 family)